MAVYRVHLRAVIGASLALQGAQLVLSMLLVGAFGQAIGVTLAGVLSLVVCVVTTGVYTVLLVALRDGHPRPTVTHLLTATLPWTGPLTLLALLTTLGEIVGLLFLIVPGLLLTLLWSLAPAAMVAEGISASDALKRSWAAAMQAWGAVTAITIFQGLVGVGIPQIASLMGSDVTLLMLVAQGLITAIIAPLAAIALGELYLRLSGYAAPLADAVGETPEAPAAAAFPQAPAGYQSAPAAHEPVPVAAQAVYEAEPVTYVPAPAPIVAPVTRTVSVPPPGLG